MSTLSRLRSAIYEDLNQLDQLLRKLNSLDYQKKIALLSGSSIGQHIRHILEFYQCAFSSVYLSSLCYDERKRDHQMESNPAFASCICHGLINTAYLLDSLDIEKEVVLKANFSSSEEEEEVKLKTSLMREMAYCLEHSVHHQALIKIGLITLGLNDTIHKEFGIAPATQRFMSQNQIQA